MEASALQAPAGLGRFSVSTPLLRLRSDDQLVALFRAGNEAAFGVIHDRYRQRLFAYTRQMLPGSRQDAEDALQDVFLRAYGALRADDRPISLRAWLYRVAHNRCVDQLRRVAPPPADVLDVSRTPLHDPLAETERREDLRRLVDDVRRLPEQQRSALLMRELEGLSYSELGSALGVTIPAVKSLLVRARIGLAEAVEARDAACGEVRADLAAAHGRGVRSSGLARRHMRDCPGCREYRHQLRLARRSFAALTPAAPGPIAALLQLLGIGGGSGAGAAAGSGAAGGTAAVGAAGTAGAAGTLITSAGTATKVAAIVCGAAITAGGAVEVHHRVVDPPAPKPAVRQPAAAPATAPVAKAAGPAQPRKQSAGATSASGAAATATIERKRDRTAAKDEPISPHVDDASTMAVGVAPVVAAQPDPRGGVAAPDEEAPPPAAEQAPAPEAQTTDPAATSAPVAQEPAAPAEASTVPPEEDESGALPAKGPGGLSAPPAP